MRTIISDPETWLPEKEWLESKTRDGLAVFIFIEMPTEFEPGSFPCKTSVSTKLTKEEINFILDEKIIQQKAKQVEDDLRAVLNAEFH